MNKTSVLGCFAEEYPQLYLNPALIGTLMVAADLEEAL